MRDRWLLPFVLAAVAVALAFVFIAPAFAIDADCVPFGDAQIKVLDKDHEAQDKGGLTLAQLDFARGLSAATPPYGSYPHDRHATLWATSDGSSAVIFYADGMSCATLWLTPELTKTLTEFGQREQAP